MEYWLSVHAILARLLVPGPVTGKGARENKICDSCAHHFRCPYVIHLPEGGFATAVHLPSKILSTNEVAPFGVCSFLTIFRRRLCCPMQASSSTNIN